MRPAYRWQIREHVRHADGRNTFGRVLWTEEVQRTEKCPAAFRESTVVAKANQLAEERGPALSLAAGTIPARGYFCRFKPLYFVSVPTGMKPTLELIGGAA